MRSIQPLLDNIIIAEKEINIQLQGFCHLLPKEILQRYLLFHFYMLKFHCIKALFQGDVIMNSKIKDDYVDYLFKAIMTLDNLSDCYDFFEDLCTVPEIKAMAQRLTVAKMLDEKKVYSDIVSETGASTATISRVNRSLQYGCDGYRKAFERVERFEEEQK